MPHYVCNKGAHTLLAQAISGSTDLWCGVLKGASPTKAQVKDLKSVAGLLALGGGIVEAAASGYSRKDLAGVALATENDTTDSVTISATAPVWATPASGETWLALFYFIEGASDSARIVVSVDVPSSSIATNGAQITGPAFSLTVSDPTA